MERHGQASDQQPCPSRSAAAALPDGTTASAGRTPAAGHGVAAPQEVVEADPHPNLTGRAARNECEGVNLIMLTVISTLVGLLALLVLAMNVARWLLPLD